MCVCIWREDRKKSRDRKKKEEVCSIGAFHFSVGMILSRQGSIRMHMWGWRVEGVGLWSGGFLIVLDVSNS